MHQQTLSSPSRNCCRKGIENVTDGIENVTDEIKGKGTERARYREEVAVRTFYSKKEIAVHTCAEIAALAGLLVDLAGAASCRTEATAR